MLTVLDEYTREALCVTVAAKMGSAEVGRALYPLLLKRGRPDYIRSDNGPEFAASTVPGLASSGWHPTYPDLSGLALGERLQ